MLHGIFCAPVIRWGLQGTPRYICSLASTREENTQPKEVEKAVISQSFGRNLGTILYFGSKTVKFVLSASSFIATIPADH